MWWPMASTTRFISCAIVVASLAACTRLEELDLSDISQCNEGTLVNARAPSDVVSGSSGQFFCSGTWFIQRDVAVSCPGGGECASDTNCASGELCLCAVVDNHDEPDFNGGPALGNEPTCIRSGCKGESDCAAGEHCAVSIGESGEPIETYCASPDEACFFAAVDCDVGEFCRLQGRESVCARPNPGSEGP